MRANLLGPEPTLLPEEPDVLRAVSAPELSASDVATAHPTSSLAWALLADEAFTGGRTLESYAFARVGYHRGLDALRGSGWKGHGPIPWSHEPNRGVLRALYALHRAAAAIGEDNEVERLAKFLDDSDPTAAEKIAAGKIPAGE